MFRLSISANIFIIRLYGFEDTRSVKWSVFQYSVAKIGKTERLYSDPDFCLFAFYDGERSRKPKTLVEKKTSPFYLFVSSRNEIEHFHLNSSSFVRLEWIHQGILGVAKLTIYM